MSTKRLVEPDECILEILARSYDNVDWRRVCAFEATSKCDKWRAWRTTRRYGRTVGTREGHDYTGWRQHHMFAPTMPPAPVFWVWYAADVSGLFVLATIEAQEAPP